MKNSVLEQLSIEPGQLTFKGVRYMLIRPDTIIDFQKAVEAAMGKDKCAELMVAGGISGGSRSSQKYRETFGYNEEEIVQFMCEMGGELGWGAFHLEQFDMESRKLVIEVTDSPFAVAYGQSNVSVCHITRGVLTGLGSSIFEGEVSSSETTCMAKGDRKCRFEITRREE